MPIIIFVLALLLAAPAHATTIYFEDTLEDGTLDVGSGHPQPTWYWPSNTATTGANAWWKITNVDKHSGNWAMRLDYSTRNGYGNNCGGTTVYQHASHGNQAYFVSSTGADLTQSPYFNIKCGVGCTTLCTLADGGTHYFYNVTKNFTRWTISAIGNQEATNDKLTLTDCVAGLGYTCGVDADIDVGDQCFFGHACGVDGDVTSGSCGGIAVDRRNDCDQHTVYLEGYTNSTFPFGTTLYRRFYFKLSSDYVKPTSTQKIGYWGTTDYSGTADPLLENKMHGASLIYGCSAGPLSCFETPSAWGPNIYSGSPFSIQLNQWYYFEEMYKSSSAAFAYDGEYKMWIVEDGQTVGDPKVWVRGNVNLRTTGYEWIQSTAYPNTYRLQLAGGGAPNIDRTRYLNVNESILLFSGNIATLAVNQWAYGNKDSLGYDTFYVRLSDDTDPDSKSDGYIKTACDIAPPGKNVGGVSIWGNKQAYEDMAGYAYVDDIIISDTYNGPTGYVAPYCGDASCNGDETCATCEADCGACPETCGDESCNGAETCQTCPGDCGACPPSCGDGTCNGTETCSTCPQDCGSCAGAGVGAGRRVHGGCIIGGGMKVQ